MSATPGQLRLRQGSASDRRPRRRRVSQAAALGGHHVEHPEAGPGERGHAGLAVPRETGDGRRDVAAGPVSGGDQDRAATAPADLAPPRGPESRAESLPESRQCSARCPSSDDADDDDDGALQEFS